MFSFSTKIDLEEERVVSTEEGKQMARSLHAKFIETRYANHKNLNIKILEY